MGKPRIIIADTDTSYIAPLQLKFVEEYFEKIDLEIITDKDLFYDIFTTPQQVDILIVHEELYSQDLQRHNVEYIFLMTEECEKALCSDLNVNYIFKYTSLKEIFNEITGKSASVFDKATSEKKETQVILVYSACGGVGKTTVAMGLCAGLERNYKNVLYINADHMQTFQRLLENESAIIASDIYMKLASGSENLYDIIKPVIRKEKFAYLPPFKGALISLGLKYSLYKEMILFAKESMDYDYIIVDADSTFDEDKVQLLGIADKIMIVTTPAPAAIYATNTLVSNVAGMSGDRYIFICNMFEKEKEIAIQSSSYTTKFTISDYIEYNVKYEKLKFTDLIKDKEIQKTAFLVM